MSDNVFEMGAHDNMSVKEAVEVVKRENLTEVLIIGYNKNDELVIRSSAMSASESLYLLEQAKMYTMGLFPSSIINDD